MIRFGSPKIGVHPLESVAFGPSADVLAQITASPNHVQGRGRLTILLSNFIEQSLSLGLDLPE